MPVSLSVLLEETLDFDDLRAGEEQDAEPEERPQGDCNTGATDVTPAEIDTDF